MEIRVRAFASYREAIGAPRVRLDLPDGSTPSQVWNDLMVRFPQLERLPRPSTFAVNEEYVSGNAILRDQDELVLIPPVSGGTQSSQSSQSTQSTQSTAETRVELVEQPIDINALFQRVRHPQAGAIVLFLGTVRDHNRGRHVRYLEYEAYQAMALREMRRVADEVCAKWPLLGIAIVHRLGHLDVGEISVAVAVSAGHRKEAFEAGRFAIDTLKQTVPIWKKEVWEGGEAWIGSEPAETGV